MLKFKLGCYKNPGCTALYSVLTWDVTIWRIYIIAALTASVNAAMNASVKHALLVHGFSFSKSHCFYKRKVGGPCPKHQSVAAMAFLWCSCSRPPEICVVLSNKRC